MIACASFADKRIAVVGLGRSGMASARALKASGARVVVWDDNAPARAVAEAEGFAASPPETIDWAATAALVLSPGIPHTHPTPHPAAQMAKDAGAP
ncbi:MAG: UDP-N-acetylmuramoyl-L-alanine--D-glutamate ligase, partial [Alphaproteobacteria bacterium]|nr:UDP-N-acetylmuramoyl-L-alanine--D-glutamate ligase [Alphaproteobacteria bacterium]